MAAVNALFVYVILDTGRVGTLSFAAILAILAWLVGHFAGVAGAPRSVWSAILVGSLPLEALLALGIFGTGDPLFAAGWAASLVLPPLVVFIEMRRLKTNSSTASCDDVASDDSTSQSDT
jgi:hypothetical protein